MLEKIIKWAFLSIFFTLIILMFVFFSEPWLLRNFSATENAELVFGPDVNGEADFEKVVTLTAAERDELISYLDIDHMSSGGICTPEQISIRLSKGNKTALLFPAGDRCGLGFGSKKSIDKSIFISSDNMSKLIAFIQDRMPSQEEMPLFKNYDFCKYE